METPPLISVLIVTYNSQSDIITCLESIIQSAKNFRLQIIIVDNNSSDNTVELVKKYSQNIKIDIQLIESPENTGYTKGNNTALDVVEGGFILFLNPDTRIIPGFFEYGTEFLQTHPETGVIAPQHIAGDNSIQKSCREFPSYDSILFEVTGLSTIFRKSRIFNRWKMGYFDHSAEREVDQPMGACLLARRDVVRKVGRLDDRFDMFFSDVDWCRRVYLAGFSIIFTDRMQIFHKMGSSVKRYPARMIWKSHYAFYQYLQKYKRGSVCGVINIFAGITLFTSAIMRIFLAKLKRLI